MDGKTKTQGFEHGGVVVIPQTFTISYTHRNFASLKPEKAVAKKETFDPTVLWNYVGREKLVDRKIEDLSTEKVDDHIDGTIRLMLDSLEMTGVEVGKDFEVIFMDTERGGRQLPAANFTVEIVFTQSIPGRMMRGVKWNSDFVRQFSWERRLKEEFKEGFAIAKRIINKPSYSPSFEEKHRHGKWSDLIDLLRVLDETIDTGNLKEVEKQFNELLPRLAEMKKRDDKTGRVRRGKIANEISKLSKTRNGFRRKIDPRVVEGAEDFGKHIFNVFSHYMNKVIRYFKYERMQYWMEEIRPTEEGYFYIENRTMWNNAWELVPYGKHNIHLHMLTKDFNYLTSEDWSSSVEIIKNVNLLDLYAEGFTLGGVFSQTYRSLVDCHFEQATVLGVIGLESAIKFILADQRKFPDKASTPFRPVDRKGEYNERLFYMINAAKKYFTPQMLNIPEQDLARLWKSAHSAREMRNSVIHDKKGIRKTPENRSMVIGWLDSLRRLSYQLDMWRDRTFH